MLGRVIRGIILGLLQLYYPHIAVEGREHLPRRGAVVFVLNHPNGLLDPLLLMHVIGRRVAFLAKNTFFKNPLGLALMNAFGALPVFRQRDAAAGDNTQQRNDETFARCRKLLGDGMALALFPEGTTHSEHRLLPLRTGAARIALGAEAEQHWVGAITVVPVGLWYQHKQRFRSSVLLIIGKPFSINHHRVQYNADREAAYDQLTAEIDQHLRQVVFQANNAELVRGLPVLVDWTIEHLEGQEREQRRQTKQLTNAYQRLAATDPEKLNELAESASRYARTLRLLGITDPWSLELPLIRRTRYVFMLALLVVGAPFALAGFLLSYLPYRLSGIISKRMTHELEVLGTINLIAGMVLVPLFWLIVAFIVGWLTNARVGVLVFVIAPLLSYSALRWAELGRDVREATQAAWLRIFRPNLTQQLIERRRQLSYEIVTTVLGLND